MNWPTLDRFKEARILIKYDYTDESKQIIEILKELFKMTLNKRNYHISHTEENGIFIKNSNYSEINDLNISDFDYTWTFEKFKTYLASLRNLIYMSQSWKDKYDTLSRVLNINVGLSYSNDLAISQSFGRSDRSKNTVQTVFTKSTCIVNDQILLLL